MSAFVVEDQVINRVVTFLSDASEFKYDRLEVIKAADLVSRDQWQESLGVTLFFMNCDAVEQRYGEGEASKFRPLDYEFRPEPCAIIQAVKSLQCLLYQCSEGNVPERPLYKALRELEFSMLKSIVDRLPEYEVATW